MTDLGTLGGNDSSAFDINNSEQIVGFAKTSSGLYHAFLYQDSVMHDLGLIDGDQNYAYGINDLGQIVGHSNTPNAFLYSNGTMFSLNDLIDPASGWQLEHAFDINNHGQIVGYGYINGAQHAYLLTPIPEPASLILFLIGGIGIIRGILLTTR